MNYLEYIPTGLFILTFIFVCLTFYETRKGNRSRKKIDQQLKDTRGIYSGLAHRHKVKREMDFMNSIVEAGNADADLSVLLQLEVEYNECRDSYTGRWLQGVVAGKLSTLTEEEREEYRDELLAVIDSQCETASSVPLHLRFGRY